jgi:hypothetical protein
MSYFRVRLTQHDNNNREIESWIDAKLDLNNAIRLADYLRLRSVAERLRSMQRHGTQWPS